VYLGYEGGRSRVLALQQAVTSAQASLDFNVKAYRKGVRLNSDVLSAEDRLYSLQRNYIEARIAALMWGVRLKDAAGELEESDIVQLNSMLAIPQGG
jgi:outer membrane protein